MQIRRVRPDEWAALRDLRLKALESDPDAFGNTLESALADDDTTWRLRADRPDGVAFVAVADDGRLVGMANGGPAHGQPVAAGLYGMWVAPEARGRGVGRSLLEAVEGWARETGHGLITLGVTTTNGAALRLYAAAGYIDTGERHPLRDGTDLQIALLSKPL